MAAALGGVKKYGQDTPIPLDKVLEVCGLDDALWSLRIIIEEADKEIRLFVCDCAERVLPIFEKKFPDYKRPRQAIEVSRRFAVGEATQEELATAFAAAAWDAAFDAAEAAWDAAYDTAWEAAWDAAYDTAYDTAWDAEREWQTQRFCQLLNNT